MLRLLIVALCCFCTAAGAQPVQKKQSREKSTAPAEKPSRAKSTAPAEKPARTKSTAPAEKPKNAAPDAARPLIPVVPMEEFASEPAPEPETAVSQPEAPSACRLRIADRLAVIEPLSSLSGPGDCGATDVVRLEAVIQPDKSRVAITPPATLRCSMAEALAVWIREDLTPATAALGSQLRALDNYASYDCRGRNRVVGARISEHGLANAIDIRGVNLSNGKFVDFTDRKADRDFRDAVRKSACARFTTVLGPGSDGYHETHIHLDLAQRRGGYRLCQWNVLDPPGETPLPRPRPRETH